MQPCAAEPVHAHFPPVRPRTECGARSLSTNSTLGWLKFGRAARTAAAHIAPRLRPGRGLGCRAGGLGCCRAHHWPRPSAPCAELPCSRPAPRGADLDPATCIVLSGFDFVAPVQPASVWDSVTANSAPHVWHRLRRLSAYYAHTSVVHGPQSACMCALPVCSLILSETAIFGFPWATSLSLRRKKQRISHNM